MNINTLYEPHPARILIALGLGRQAIVLATDSDWVEQELADIANDCDDVGILARKDYDKPPGIYLWTGTLRSICLNTPDTLEYETEYHGEFKPVPVSDMEELLKMEPPERKPFAVMDEQGNWIKP